MYMERYEVQIPLNEGDGYGAIDGPSQRVVWNTLSWDGYDNMVSYLDEVAGFVVRRLSWHEV